MIWNCAAKPTKNYPSILGGQNTFILILKNGTFAAFMGSQFKCVQLFGCFIFDVPTRELIDYMSETSGLFMMKEKVICKKGMYHKPTI